jgi:hypothetical protein
MTTPLTAEELLRPLKIPFNDSRPDPSANTHSPC